MGRVFNWEWRSAESDRADDRRKRFERPGHSHGNDVRFRRRLYNAGKVTGRLKSADKGKIVYTFAMGQKNSMIFWITTPPVLPIRPVLE